MDYKHPDMQGLRIGTIIPGEVRPGDILIEMGWDPNGQRRDKSQVIGTVLAVHLHEQEAFPKRRWNWTVRKTGGDCVCWPAEPIEHQVYVHVPERAL